MKKTLSIFLIIVIIAIVVFLASLNFISQIPNEISSHKTPSYYEVASTNNPVTGKENAFFQLTNYIKNNQDADEVSRIIGSYDITDLEESMIRINDDTLINAWLLKGIFGIDSDGNIYIVEFKE